MQGGTLYGLWGTLLVAYGIVFSAVIDFLGTHSFPCTLHHSCHACTAMCPCGVAGLRQRVWRRSEGQPHCVLHHQRCWKVRKPIATSHRQSCSQLSTAGTP